jgi:hypothetical protein
VGTLAEPLERRIAGVLMSALHYRERRSQASSTDLSSLDLSLAVLSHSVSLTTLKKEKKEKKMSFYDTTSPSLPPLG